MSSGRRTSESRKAAIIRMRAQGLTYKVISIRTGLSITTVAKICREVK